MTKLNHERPYRKSIDIRGCLIIVAVFINGCATSVFNAPSNVPLAQDFVPGMGSPNDIMGENAIALSFSGGGLRSAAFAYGVLEALASLKTEDGDLLNDVTYITGVSGGSLTAAYYGVYGRDGLDRFRKEVLLRDFEKTMRLSAFSPTNFFRLLGGGMNDRENFADTLGREVFHGATFADIYRHPKPDIRIHATDLEHRVSFAFIPRVFSALCSDLRSYAVSDAVAASMAVPLVFAPMTLQTFPHDCQEPLPPTLAQIRDDTDAPRLLKAVETTLRDYRDPTQTHYLKLVDGALTDNFGVSSLVVSRGILGTPYAPMTQRDAVKIRRLLFLVVDGTQGVSDEWGARDSTLSGTQIAESSINAVVDSSARLAVDALKRMIQDWQDSVIAYRCGLTREQVVKLGGPSEWKCSDVKFSVTYLSINELSEPRKKMIGSIQTRLTLSETQVDAAADGARAGALALPRLREYLRERVVDVK